MAWFPDSFTCEGCGERVDVGDCPNCTKPAAAPVSAPPASVSQHIYEGDSQIVASKRWLRTRHAAVRSDGIKVIEVLIEEDRFRVLGSFPTHYLAQAEVNKVYDVPKSFRLIYEGGRFEAGMCWTPVSDEMWYRARRIAERAFANSAK